MLFRSRERERKTETEMEREIKMERERERARGGGKRERANNQRERADQDLNQASCTFRHGRLQASALFVLSALSVLLRVLGSCLPSFISPYPPSSLTPSRSFLSSPLPFLSFSSLLIMGAIPSPSSSGCLTAPRVS